MGKHKNRNNQYDHQDGNDAMPAGQASQSAIDGARLQGLHPYYPDCAFPNQLPDGGNFGTLWTNLPNDTTYHKLFTSMRGIGAISYAQITHSPFTARVEFTETAAAMRLLRQKITIGGHEVRITPDGGRYLTQSNAVHAICGNRGRGTRALLVVGNREVVRAERLIALLNEPQHQLAHGIVYSHSSTNEMGLVTVELHFTSFASGALPARDVFLEQRYRSDLSGHKRLLWEFVTCYYLPDPCE